MKKLKEISKKFCSLDVIIGLFFSIILTFSFFILAVPDLDKKIIKIEKMYDVNSSLFTKMINLPQKSDYVIKIKYEFNNVDGATVVLNGNILERRVRINNKSDIIRTSYYYVPEEVAREGNNTLKIKFYRSNPPNVDLRIKNYIKSIANNNIILATKNSSISGKFFSGSIFFFIFSMGLWMLFIYFGRFFNLMPNQILFNNILSFLPWAGIYFILGAVSISTPYSLAITPSYLFISLFLITFIFNSSLNLVSVFFLRQALMQNQTRKIKNYELPKWLEKSLNWLKSREFSDKCVLFFVFLIIMCAFLLILGMEWLAEQFANVAYLALVIGVVIKFVRFLKENSD